MSDARALSCVISDAGRRWGAIRALLRQKYKYKIRNTNTKIYRKEMGCNQSYVETEIQIQKYAGRRWGAIRAMLRHQRWK